MFCHFTGFSVDLIMLRRILSVNLGVSVRVYSYGAGACTLQLIELLSRATWHH